MIEFKLQVGTDEATGGEGYWYIFPSRNNDAIWEEIQKQLKTDGIDNMHFPSFDEAMERLTNFIEDYDLQKIDDIRVINGADGGELLRLSKISESIVDNKKENINDKLEDSIVRIYEGLYKHIKENSDTSSIEDLENKIDIIMDALGLERDEEEEKEETVETTDEVIEENPPIEFEEKETKTREEIPEE